MILKAPRAYVKDIKIVRSIPSKDLKMPRDYVKDLKLVMSLPKSYHYIIKAFLSLAGLSYLANKYDHSRAK